MPVAWIALLATAACAGAGLPNVGASHSQSTSVALTIRVPVASAAARRNRPMYVASTTRSVTVTVTSQTTNAVVASSTFNVTSTSAGCSTVALVTTCTESLAVAPGAYTATVSTYDAASGTGNVLSEEQAVSFTALEGVANSVALTLYGVPVGITVAAGAQTAYGSQASGFTVFGSIAQTFSITAKDADGNTIVGPGLPTWSVALSSGSGFTIVQPTSGSNTFTIAPSGNVSETFKVTASFTDASVCTQTDAVCNGTFAAKRNQNLVYCSGSAGVVYMVAAPYTASPIPIDSNGCNNDYGKLAVSSYGVVFATAATTIDVIAPPYTSVTKLSIYNGGSYQGLTVDGAGDAFFCIGGAPAIDQFLFEVSPPYAVISKPGAPCTSGDIQLAYSNSNVFIDIGSGIREIPSPYTTTGPTASPGPNGGQQAIAGDATGDLAEVCGTAICIFPSATFTTPIVIPQTPSPSDISYDHAGNLFVSTLTNFYEFKPPFSSSSVVAATFAAPGGDAPRLLFDSSENLFTSGSAIYELAPPYTGTPTELETASGAYEFAITP